MAEKQLAYYVVKKLRILIAPTVLTDGVIQQNSECVVVTKIFKLKLWRKVSTNRSYFMEEHDCMHSIIM